MARQAQANKPKVASGRRRPTQAPAASATPAQAADEASRRRAQRPFPIGAIGASAGGLESELRAPGGKVGEAP